MDSWYVMLDVYGLKDCRDGVGIVVVEVVWGRKRCGNSGYDWGDGRCISERGVEWFMECGWKVGCWRRVFCKLIVIYWKRLGFDCIV